jgi:hypothetical protein
LSSIILKKTIVEKYPFKFSISENTEKIILFISVITAIVSNINVFRGYRIFGKFGGEDFEAYLGNGLTGHIAVFFKILSVFSFFIYHSQMEKIKSIVSFICNYFRFIVCIAYTTKSSS